MIASYRSVAMLITCCSLLTLHNAWAASSSNSPPADVCHGFVVLPNGFAVLSGMPADHEGAHGHPGSAQHSAMMTHEGTGHQSHAMPMAMGAGHADQMHTAAAPSRPHDVLMDYHHGQDIVPQADILCVPVANPDSTRWTATSSEPALAVVATSMHGALAHNSRANEALGLQISLAGQEVAPVQVRLLTRMPQHDRQMPGGHGPANDPDVEGFMAQPEATGGYAVSTIDFSMSGPWLFEVQVQKDNKMYKAYFATQVGQE